MNHPMNLLAPLVAVAALASCGGGAGGRGGQITANPETVQTSAPATNSATPQAPLTSLVDEVPPPTYEVGSIKAAAFATLNAERSRCGFGLVAQSPALDRASEAHLRYLAFNNELDHVEVSANPGFTGAAPRDRAQFAGYGDGQVSEGIAFAATSDGEFAVRSLLSTPYHALTLLWGARDFGFHSGPTNGWVTYVAMLGINAGANLQESPVVTHYPCDGTTGVQATVLGEVPSPFPNETSPTWGQPIIVKGSEALRVTSASITASSGTVPIKAIYGDGQTVDPNGYCKAGWACVIPEQLTATTTYSVTIAWTDKGGPGSSGFTFTTGAR